jgi:hypothetical protein
MALMLIAFLSRIVFHVPPPDLVEGPAADDQMDMIEGLMTDFECE